MVKYTGALTIFKPKKHTNEIVYLQKHY